MATGQAFAWPDGSVYLYTGSDGASALVAYATDTNMRNTHGAVNFQTLTGTWGNVATGRISRVSVGNLYTTDAVSLLKLASAETAVHMHLRHAYPIAGGTSASGGVYLWSGFIDSVEVAGREKDIFRMRLEFHSNDWSAY